MRELGEGRECGSRERSRVNGLGSVGVKRSVGRVGMVGKVRERN